MLDKFGIIVGFSLIIIYGLLTPVYGAEEWVTLTTDKLEYLDGDIISVEGRVFQLYSSHPMTLMVIAPNNNVVYLDQITVNSDKKFNAEFKAGGVLMKESGNYKIIAQYGSNSRTAEIEFQYGAPEEIEPEPELIVRTPPRQITIDGFNMAYSMTSGEVTNMSPNQNTNALTISVDNTNEDGILTVAIPRDVLDSVIDRTDVEFFAFINSINVDIEEVETNEFERTIMINYPVGTRTIEIMGTHAIPEFGALTFMILTASIMTTLFLMRYLNNPIIQNK